MKLIIQIPCYNEGEVIAATVALLPRQVEGFDAVELLVIDDGSRDNTLAAARAAGVDHIARLPFHQGLARAFAAGLDASLRCGADVILNTDADNQYQAEDIPLLLAPILRGEAQIAIGDRGVADLEHFHPLKRQLQVIGSQVVSWAAGLTIPDSTSGFRAITREAALRTMVLSDYSYTLETLIQAGNSKIPVVSVAVRTNPPTRPSRLIRTVSNYVKNSSVTIIRSFTLYRPLRVFSLIGGVLLLAGLVLGGRYILLRYILNENVNLIQSLILTAVLLLAGFQTLLIGLVADLIAFNRKMLEETLYRLRREQSSQPEPEKQPER